VVCQKTTRTMYCWHARGDWLVQGQRAGIAVMGRGRLKLLPVLSFGLLAFYSFSVG
jgi:hypothetical protein